MTSISIIIPAFGRLGPLRHTLRSAASALAHYGAKDSEILLVDDGSTPPLAELLVGENFGWAVTHLCQSNQGSIIARQTGLLAARCDWILFLDSDDLIPPEKFRSQLGAMPNADWDIIYADMARALLTGQDVISYEPAETLARTDDPAEFFLCIQPAPHNPLYRRGYLVPLLAHPLVPPERHFDTAGDVWLYYNLCTSPARLLKVDAPLAAAGVHDELRYSNHWERLGVAALGIMQSFIAHCPVNADTLPARTMVGERAFHSWRALPRHFDSAFTRGMLAVWQCSPRGPVARLGGRRFQTLARLLGPEAAARLLRLRNAPYNRIRTLNTAQYDALFGATPPA